MKKIAYLTSACAVALTLAGCGGGGSGTISTCIVFNGLKYCPATSPYTGKLWLDRNLGASEVCTSPDDAQCFGDYYQWGRYSDGHEKANSSTTTSRLDISNSPLDTNSSFVVLVSSTPPLDWAINDDNGNIRKTFWELSDGTSVCPQGFRVPTALEVNAELTASGADIGNNSDAFNSFLKLPSAGYRNYLENNNTVADANTTGALWTTDTPAVDLNSDRAVAFEYNTTAVTPDFNASRITGRAVRCISN